jgi:hypothetical protein
MKTIKTDLKEVKELFDQRQKLGDDNMPMIKELEDLKKDTDELHKKLKANEARAIELQPVMVDLNEKSMELTQKLQDVVIENYADQIEEDEHYNSIQVVGDDIVISIKSHKDYIDEYNEKVVERIKIVKEGMVKKEETEETTEENK